MYSSQKKKKLIQWKFHTDFLGTATKNVKRKRIRAGKTNHNSPRKCLLYHVPFHSAFTSSPDILLSGRRTTWNNPLNFFQKIASITLCIMRFPLKALADQERKWIRIIFHRTVPYKSHFDTGASLYQPFSPFTHVLSEAAEKQRAKLYWWQRKPSVFRLSEGSEDQTLNGWRNPGDSFFIKEE